MGLNIALKLTQIMSHFVLMCTVNIELCFMQISTPSATEMDESSNPSDIITDEAVDDLITTGPPNLKDFGAKFLLKVREEYRIPQSTLNKLINDVKELWVVALDSIKIKLESMSSAIDIESFKKCFEDSFPLDGLES